MRSDALVNPEHVHVQIHKMYAGMLDVYHYNGNQQALDIVINVTDVWLIPYVSKFINCQEGMLVLTFRKCLGIPAYVVAVADTLCRRTSETCIFAWLLAMNVPASCTACMHACTHRALPVLVDSC